MVVESNPCGGEVFLFSPNRPDQLWGPLIIVFSEYHGFFFRVKRPVYEPGRSPLYSAFMVWTEVSESEWVYRGFGTSRPRCTWALKPALCAPCPIKGALKLQMAPRLILWISLGSKKRSPDMHVWVRTKPHIYQRIWAKVSSITRHFLRNGLSCSPSR